MCKWGALVVILQEEFMQNGYKNLLIGENAYIYQINLEDLFDLNQMPTELLGIFISEKRDELFFLLNGDSMEINNLCDTWDDRIRVFTIVNGKNTVIQDLKYNIVQLIIYSNGTPDKNREGNLLISRKIILKGNVDEKDRIFIGDDEVIELPFHMISSDAFSPDEGQINTLKQLLPKEEGVLSILKKKQKKVNKKEREGILDKSFEIQDFEKIKEWLET